MPSTEAHQVLAYGSNMDLTDLRRWMLEHLGTEPTVYSWESALLKDYALGWNYRSVARGAGAANAIAAPQKALPGLILSVDQETFQAIDKKEGHPNRYSRGEAPLQVELSSKESTSAWVYRVTPALLQKQPVWPTEAYLNLIKKAANEHAFPSWYIEELAATPTLSASI